MRYSLFPSFGDVWFVMDKVHEEALLLYPGNTTISVQLYGDLGHNPGAAAVHALQKLSKSIASDNKDVDVDAVHLPAPKMPMNGGQFVNKNDELTNHSPLFDECLRNFSRTARAAVC